LSAGCTSTVTRNYTFLSELPAAVARSTAPVDIARLSGAPIGTAGEQRSSSAVPAQDRAASEAPAHPPGGGAAVAATSPNRRLPAARAAEPPPQRRAPPLAVAAAPQPANRARLVVEPLDL